MLARRADDILKRNFTPMDIRDSPKVVGSVVVVAFLGFGIST